LGRFNTAPTFLLNIQKLSGFEVPGAGLFYSVLVICYFSYAVICLKHEKRYMVVAVSERIHFVHGMDFLQRAINNYFVH
jgi:hypothetical protein